MKKFLAFFALTIAALVMASIVSLHPGQATSCPDMSDYMINAAGECINLNSVPANNVSTQGASDERASASILSASQRSEFPPQQNVNTIVVDNNNAFLAAIRRLKAGDRLLVKNGVYKARVVSANITVKAQGDADNWIVIAAYPGDKPQIKGTDSAAINFNDAQYVEMRGFEVVGAFPSQNPSGSGILVNNRSNNIRLLNNTIHDAPGGGIEVQHADYLYIEGNRVYNSAWGWLPTDPNSSYGYSGISLYQLMNAEQSKPEIRNIVRGNIVHNVYNTQRFIASDMITDGNCFILDDTKYAGDRLQSVIDGYASPYTGTTLVENNLCVDNGGRGIHSFVSDNLIARNNTLYKNAKTPEINGELSAISSSNIRFYNNIVYARSGSRAIVNFKSSGVVIENNLLFGSDLVDRGVGTLIKADPLFVNATIDLDTADFSLRQGSPAIGAGSDENCAETYFDGSARVSCDLGAFLVVR